MQTSNTELKIDVPNCQDKDDRGRPCGICNICVDRITGFILNSERDTTEYQISVEWDRFVK